MKKNKKGFTLIELLAIIVILAIIAVITVPIILNVIDNARKGAIQDSAYGYKDAINKYYVTKLSEDYSFRLDGTYNINEDGSITDENEVTHVIPFSGNKPIGGSLVYEDNILKSGNILFDGYIAEVVDGEIGTVSKGSGEEDTPPEVTYKCIRATVRHKEECTQTDENGYCSGTGYTGQEIEYGNLGSGDDLVSGDAFDCDVDGDEIYDSETERFYYVSDLYNTTTKEFDSTYAVLIYYNSTINGEPNKASGGIPYDSTHGYDEDDYYILENWHGPLSAINELPTTEQWSNVSLSSTDRAILNENEGVTTGTTGNAPKTLPTSFSYEGYAARFLTTQEIESACGISSTIGTSDELDTCNYLMENTKYLNSSLGTYGYWLETPHMTTSYDAWIVNGYTRSMSTEFVVSEGVDYAGTRPAIEVLKTDIQK